METKKSTLLKVVSILMIIGGLLTLIMGITFLATGAIADEASADATGVGLIVILAMLAIVTGVFDLIAGAVGCRASSGKGSAKACKVFAVIILVLAIIGLIGNLRNSTSLDSTLSSIGGILFPVLYYIGARQVSK